MNQAMRIGTSSFKIAVLLLFSAVLLLSTGCNQWVERGPKSSGRVSAITATDANHVWAASPGGGVWKTQDGGANWAWAGNYALGDFTVLGLQRDRTDSSQLFLRVWNGFLVSTDGAATWTQTLYSQGGDTSYFQPAFSCTGLLLDCAGSNPGFEPLPLTQMVFPSRRLVRHKSIVFTALPCGGLQYSTDYGASFTQIWPFAGDNPAANPDNCITSIAADEVTGKVYFASMGYNFNGSGVGPSGTHIFRSTMPWTPTGPPSPLAWEAVNTGIDSFRTAQALVWGGSADRLMALVNDNSDQPIPYLFDGTTWTTKPVPADAPNCFLGEENSRPLVWGGGNDFFLGGTRFAYTVNAGDTWVCPDPGIQYVDIRAIYADRARIGVGRRRSKCAR